MFSPYYRRAWRRGAAQAGEHCALNLCLYGPEPRWTMTERGGRHVEREARRMRIGPSELHWSDGGLEVEFDERAAPLPRAMRGHLRLTPGVLSRYQASIDGEGRHRWGPIAPCARIELQLSHPRLHWKGDAYFDSNEGDEPIDRGFHTWDWMRAPLADGGTAVVYDVRPRAGGERVLARRFFPDGHVEPFATPERQPLAGTGWRIARQVRSEAVPRVLRTLEDTPFYARSLVQTQLAGETVTGMHETLSATRFAAPWVQALLPFRMPRRA